MELPGGLSDKDWDKANSVIPADSDLFDEKLSKLLAWCYSKDLYLPESEQKLLKLKAHIAAMRAYRNVFKEAEKAKKKIKAA